MQARLGASTWPAPPRATTRTTSTTTVLFLHSLFLVSGHVGRSYLIQHLCSIGARQLRSPSFLLFSLSFVRSSLNLYLHFRRRHHLLPFSCPCPTSPTVFGGGQDINLVRSQTLRQGSWQAPPTGPMETGCTNFKEDCQPPAPMTRIAPGLGENKPDKLARVSFQASAYFLISVPPSFPCSRFHSHEDIMSTIGLIRATAGIASFFPT